MRLFLVECEAVYAVSKDRRCCDELCYKEIDQKTSQVSSRTDGEMRIHEFTMFEHVARVGRLGCQRE